jgi:hypothetical protein
LYIFSDYAKITSQEIEVKKVRTYLKSITGFKTISITEREQNYGLSKSITSGIEYVLSKHNNVIVLEDDLLTSPLFLTYMNTALSKFENVNKVASISAYSYPTKNPLPDFFFLNRAECWGWATWRDQWKEFNYDGKYLAEQIKRQKLIKNFDYNNQFKFYKMLCDQARDLNDSWAIRWDASLYLAKKYTLYPGKSYVQNIGFDGDGVNCGISNNFDVELNKSLINFDEIDICVSKSVWFEYVNFYKSLKKSLWKRIANRIF